MLDTGSTVSTICESFYEQNLQDVEIQDIGDLFELKCADGSNLPYKGAIELDVISEGLGDDRQYTCLFLVVNDTDYHQKVPVLLGTNILNSIMGGIKECHGERFLQISRLHEPWYWTFRCLALRERELVKNKYRLAVIKSAERNPITIQPNSEMTIEGYADKMFPYKQTMAIIQTTEKSAIPADLDIIPNLVDYNPQKRETVWVTVSNVTTRTVRVPPRAIIAEIQPVTVEDIPEFPAGDNMSQAVDFNIAQDNLTKEEFAMAKEVIERNRDIFSWGETDIGHVTTVKHRIEMTDNTPFRQRHRRIPPSMFKEVRDHIQQLLTAGIIRKSKSPFSSNVVLVRKKNGDLRMCVDYRQLNNKTKKDAYALPRIEEILDSLSGNSYFTVLDAKSGYHQIEIEESHKERTAFTVGPLGFFEYNRMPFGLSNSPATYQRLMEDCLGELNLNICFIFLDDIIIFSRTYEEHLDRLQQVFDKLRTAGLKLSPKKCNFFQERVRYVGHIVSNQGIETDPEKTNKVLNWPIPTTPEEVRKFLGFVGYYRKFIRNFSKIARPLSELMPIPTDSKRSSKKRGKVWKWGSEEQNAFDRLKEALATPPILGYADYSLPFELHIDASKIALGAVLYQKQGDVKRVISYASRSLTKPEQNYPAHKLEFLGLKWAVCDKFKDYLLGSKTKVLTDNNPLTYVLTSAKLDSAGHRWLASLANFDLDIQYRPGVKNSDADGLSRLTEQTNDMSSISDECMKALCQSIQLEIPFVENLSVDSELVNQLNSKISQFQQVDWKEAQHKDPVLQKWMHYVKSGKRPRMSDLPTSTHSLAFIRNFHLLIMEEGILKRKVTIDDTCIKQIVVPRDMIPVVLKNLHNDFGHQGRDRVTSLVRDRFYWNGMNCDIDRWIKNCHRCLRRKVPTNQRAPLMPIQTSYPLELVCMDFLTLEPSKGGFQHILIITDHFSRFAVAVPTKNFTAKTTAEAFYNNFITNYGIPVRIHSDQGANFDGNIIKELCLITGMKKSRTTPYHPMGNGMCERFNRTLLNMLGTLHPAQKTNWKKYLSPLVQAYNSTRHESTGQSPYRLMFGREPLLPVDVAFGINNQEKKSLTKYIEDLRTRMKTAYHLARKSADRSRVKQGKYYDLKVRGIDLHEGDRVLVKVVAFDGKHKIADKWEEEAYIVLRQPNKEVPVYVVQREDGTGKKRTLHRNLLLPIGCIDQEFQEKPIPKPRANKQKDTTQNEEETELKQQNDVADLDISDSDSEYEIQVVKVPVQRTPIEISKEPVRVVEEEVTQPEREAAEDPAPQDEEGDGSEPGDEIGLRRSARTRRPPKRFADYKLYQICDRRREELSILKQILENTNRSEERNILLGCISDIISKL